MFRLLLRGVLLWLLLVGAAGCGTGGSTPTTPPEGWQADGPRWWKTGIDTTQAFRPMETLADLSIRQPNLALGQSGLSQSQFNSAIKRSLLPLYRHAPAVVDSLFERYGTTPLQNVDLSDPDLVQRGGRLNPDVVSKAKKAAYTYIREHFREPQRKRGDDQPRVPYPDSLRTPEASGKVQVQVRLDSTGTPIAVWLLDGPHPTLNALTMRTVTQRDWEPAYVKRTTRWQPLPSWVRFSITFRPPPEG
jgi:hypothetical protein